MITFARQTVSIPNSLHIKFKPYQKVQLIVTITVSGIVTMKVYPG